MDIGHLQDSRFQERDWRAQRIGWAVLTLLVVAAAAGLLGPGPLSLSSATSAGGAVEVEYYRFARFGGDGAVTVTVSPDAIGDGAVQVWWNSAYLNEMQVDNVTPEPDIVTAGGGRVRYEFAAAPGDDLTITFDLTPDGLWSKRAEVIVADERVTYDQFVYP